MRVRTSLSLLFLACVSAACASIGGGVDQSGVELFDPFAPNWLISEREVDAGTFALSLRAKHFRKGGDGEAFQVIRRRADQLQRETGAIGYRIVDYSEGIESGMSFSYRVSKGTVVLVLAP